MSFTITATSPARLQALQTMLRNVQRLALLGPEGTWTHQVALELWPYRSVECHFMRAQDMLAALRQGEVQAVLLPARTGIVGETPYMPLLQDMLALEGVKLLASYARVLGYYLLARAQASLGAIDTVHGHPVALIEAAPWLDRHLPQARRIECLSAGHAARIVARADDARGASLGPALAGELHGLVSLVSGIEEGPHNVTEWWVVGPSVG